VRELVHDRTRRQAMGAAARDFAASLTWEACAQKAETVLRSAGAPADQSP
jgi:hypothetical protein